MELIYMLRENIGGFVDYVDNGSNKLNENWFEMWYNWRSLGNKLIMICGIDVYDLKLEAIGN